MIVPISKQQNYDGDSWCTPPDLIEDARTVLETIDTDPASNDYAQTYIRATIVYNKEDDGLSKDWSGRVWLNPPYSAGLIDKYISKAILEYAAYHHTTGGLILTNNCTETRWFQELLSTGIPVCLLRRRVQFLMGGKSYGSRQGQAVFAYGDSDLLARFRGVFGKRGTILCAR